MLEETSRKKGLCEAGIVYGICPIVSLQFMLFITVVMVHGQSLVIHN